MPCRAVDSTVIKFRGDGEWLVRKHGASRRRQWRKVHIAMDTGTGDVRAVEFTSSRQGDSPLLPESLAQIPPDEPIETVTADGAYDTRRCHAAIIDRGAHAVIPIRRNGCAWKEDCPAALARNEILRAPRRLGRTLWKRWADYHVRSRIEANPLVLWLLVALDAKGSHRPAQHLCRAVAGVGPFPSWSFRTVYE